MTKEQRTAKQAFIAKYLKDNLSDYLSTAKRKLYAKQLWYQQRKQETEIARKSA